MSDTAPQPVPPPAPPPRPSLLGCAFVFSFLLNVALAAVIFAGCIGLSIRSAATSDPASLSERHHSGPRSASARVAVVEVEGVILEGFLGHVHRQIDQAARDPAVKAVVLRVNSPGGSITASHDLHQRLVKLAKGDPVKKTDGKPLVASFASLAASGGYYVAMPASRIFAEETTITGSIGVYATFPNVKGLGDKVGFSMNTLRAGDLKEAGSPFKEMSDLERQALQDTVEAAYARFLAVVEKGRPALGKGKLLERFTVEPLRPDPQSAGAQQRKPYTRYRADGGIFGARRAVELKLVDRLGDLDDAVRAAARAAELDEDGYQAIRYPKPPRLLDFLIGARAAPQPPRVAEALSPRLWYLAPGHQAAGFAAALETPR